MTYDNTNKLPGDRAVPEIGDDIVVVPMHGNKCRMIVRAVYNMSNVTLVTGAAVSMKTGERTGRDRWHIRLDKWSFA